MSFDTSALTSGLFETFGGEVTYSRGAASVSLTAVARGQGMDAPLSDGDALRKEYRAFQIQAAELILSGAVTRPAVGDRIVETISGASQTFEVLDIAGEGCFKFIDAAETVLLVHTKRIA